jgi:hypothetical protein
VTAPECPKCQWFGVTFTDRDVQVCVNPECQVFSWTLDPAKKESALQLLMSLLDGLM